MGETGRKWNILGPTMACKHKEQRNPASFFIFYGLVFFAKVSVPNCGSRSSSSPGKNKAVQPLGHITSVFASSYFTLPTLEYLRAGNSTLWLC